MTVDARYGCLTILKLPLADRLHVDDQENVQFLFIGLANHRGVGVAKAGRSVECTRILCQHIA